MENNPNENRKNVILLCLSPLNRRGKTDYIYYFHEKEHFLSGFMTNEAPVKRVVEQLHEDHGQRLDRIVMICSDEAFEKINPEKVHRDFINQYEEYVPGITHEMYFRCVIRDFAERIDEKYKEISDDDWFQVVNISSFSDEREVMKAVVDSADKVMDGLENIDLYIDFNGGPRNVAVLILGLANLMKIRDVNVKEISFMDSSESSSAKEEKPSFQFLEESNVTAESFLRFLRKSEVTAEPLEKTETKTKYMEVKSMGAVFGCVDLVAGINEYINYGRIQILKSYFDKCDDQRIQIILRSLEEFADNMQMCRTDYVMANKERVKRDLETYRKDSQKISDCGGKDAYEIMFSFVVEDILRGCSQLLSGDLPEMILWCVEKNFIVQASMFYKELMPAYFWDNGIFSPTLEEQLKYAGWQIDCEHGGMSDENVKIYKNNYQSLYEKYCWLVHYLPNTQPDLSGELSYTQSAGMGKREDYDICRIIGQQIEDAMEKAGRVLLSLDSVPKRVESTENYNELKQIMVEYFMIHSQSVGAGRSTVELGDAGKLWSLSEMRQVFYLAARRLGNLHKAGGSQEEQTKLREKKFINFTNHRLELWEQKQIDAAREYGEIIDIPFPNVDPQCSEQEIKMIGEQCCREILQHNPEAVLCQGEFTLTAEVVQRLKLAGIRVLAACSERAVTEKQGVKTSAFRFVRFREYH